MKQRLRIAYSSDTQTKAPRYGAELRNAPMGGAWLRNRPKTPGAFGRLRAFEAQLRRWVRDGVQLRHEVGVSIVQFSISMKLLICGSLIIGTCVLGAHAAETAQQWQVFETSCESAIEYSKPFVDVEVNGVFVSKDKKWVVPAFWAGGKAWKVRFAAPEQGRYKYHFESTDPVNGGFSGADRDLEVTAYNGDNPLLKHGFLKVGKDKRHFLHSDGTPFFWLGDTWWKCLCKRLTWDGFQELTADRKAKGFTVIQIVCGVHPDEPAFANSWENEGGKPYTDKQFRMVNTVYFEYAERRIRHLAEAGIVPAIVGGWGRNDCDSMKIVGLNGVKRHWRNLLARFGAYSTVWVIGGEAAGPEWTEIARYVKSLDPYGKPVTMHPGQSARKSVTDEAVINFDMLQTGHGEMAKGVDAIPKLTSQYNCMPPMPVLIGEYCYEGHMQTGFQDVQRYVFWGSMLSGAAGLTYGAAGIWHAGVDGDHGNWGGWGGQPYDWTTWKEGMNYPGSKQLGIGKRLLEEYPWWRFEPHPEWVEAGCFAAGIPKEVRFIYKPKQGVYNWNGPAVKGLEPDVTWHAFYFDPASGRRFDQGTVKATAKVGDKAGHAVDFKRNVPSPQDWVLVLERVK